MDLSGKKWAGAALLSLAFVSTVQATTLLNCSYDVSRELFSALNPLFEKQWDQAHPDDPLILRQSHGGSSRQALTILQGLRADVVTYNQVPDVQILHDKGHLIPADWQQRLPDNSSPFYSTMAFLVRKGNPKHIHQWADLTQPGVSLVFPNPKTSGNGRYTWLAALGAAEKADSNDPAKPRAFMTRFIRNVAVLDTGGRGATTTFAERGIGDVLISFESEINTIRQQYPDAGYEVIVPRTNILAEFPVTWIDKNVAEQGHTAAAKAYLNFLYSPAAQKVLTRFYYRVNNPQLMSENKARFPEVTLFRVEEQFGGWEQVMKTQFATGGEFDQLQSAGHK
ncbi:sulfate/thiosulfate binding protein [Tatumella ptyseos ATCC 33301]|uniref:Sulfate/thiosulfate binding protein n=2 Tax=Tatumella ptyseos TaxID=82987 RepID=A0A085JHX6_9GAMM|nr:thiosulfate ABC transporter substrate-binding protein CysP [Tatumella ptyseos]KFD20072.1 sulfate/thiosulfate binding protein [Tatumella ptyseos ATCC 33301]SQK75849.1 Thiosulfate-binding protein precursor [Tatumella ptyseos]